MEQYLEKYPLFPSPDEDKYVILAKFPVELLNQLEELQEGGVTLSIKFDKEQHNNLFTIKPEREGSETIQKSFRSERESLEFHDCYCQKDNAWHKLGPIRQKLFFEQVLSTNDQTRISQRSKQAEEDRKKHKSKMIDPREEPNKKHHQNRDLQKKPITSRSTSKKITNSSLKQSKPVNRLSLQKLNQTGIDKPYLNTTSTSLLPYGANITSTSEPIHSIQQSSYMTEKKSTNIITPIVEKILPEKTLTEKNSEDIASPKNTTPEKNTQDRNSVEKNIPEKVSPEKQITTDKTTIDTTDPSSKKFTKMEFPNLPLDVLRKTLIQVLALHPSTAQRLTQMFPKNDFTSLVSKVAHLKPPGIWNLKKELWKEVDLNWEKYSEEDIKKLQIAHKRIFGVEFGQVPTVTTNATNNEEEKKETTNSIVASLKPKKKDITLSPPKDSNVSNTTDPGIKEESSTTSKSLVLTLPNPRRKEKRKGVHGKSDNKVSKIQKLENKESIHEENNKGGEQSEIDKHRDSRSEYCSKYKEYTQLISKIKEAEREFVNLGEDWKKAPIGEKVSVGKKINDLYATRLSDIQAATLRYQTLHTELKELKELIKSHRTQ